MFMPMHCDRVQVSVFCVLLPPFFSRIQSLFTPKQKQELGWLRTFELARIGIPYQPHKNDQGLFSLNLISTFDTACGDTSIILPKILYFAFTNDRTQ